MIVELEGDVPGVSGVSLCCQNMKELREPGLVGLSILIILAGEGALGNTGNLTEELLCEL